jgi:hypothetical protein
MRKQLLSMTAAAAFLLTIGGAAAAKAVQAPTKWFQIHPETMEPTGEGIDNPICAQGEPLCVAEYEVDGQGKPETPTGSELRGTLLN